MPEIIQDHFLIFVIVTVFVLFVIIGFLVDKMNKKASSESSGNIAVQNQEPAQNVTEVATETVPTQTIAQASAQNEITPQQPAVSEPAPVAPAAVTTAAPEIPEVE